MLHGGTPTPRGLHTSLDNILKDLFVQVGLGDQSFKLAVFLLKLFQPIRLIYLQAAIFLTPRIDLFHEPAFVVPFKAPPYQFVSLLPVQNLQALNRAD